MRGVVDGRVLFRQFLQGIDQIQYLVEQQFVMHTGHISQSGTHVLRENPYFSFRSSGFLLLSQQIHLMKELLDGVSGYRLICRAGARYFLYRPVPLYQFPPPLD